MCGPRGYGDLATVSLVAYSNRNSYSVNNYTETQAEDIEKSNFSVTFRTNCSSEEILRLQDYTFLPLLVMKSFYNINVKCNRLS